MKTILRSWICIAVWALCTSSALADENDTFRQTRAWVTGKCPVADSGVPEATFASALAVLLPGVIDKGIDLLAGSLKAAGADSTTPPQLAAADGFFYLFDGAKLRQHAKLKCLIVARGEFASSGQDIQQLDSDMRTFARAYSMAKAPEFLVEARFKFSDDGRFFRLEPVTLWYAKPIESSFFSRDVRSAALTMSFYKPGTKEAFASGQMVFPEMHPPSGSSPGRRYESDMLRASFTPWMPVYPEGDATLAEVAAAKAQYDQLTKAAAAPTQPPMRPKDADDTKLASEREALCKLAETRKTTEATCPIDLVDKRATFTSLQAWADARTRSFEAHEKLKGAQRQTTVNDLALFQLQLSMTETRKGSELAKFLGSVLDASKKDLADELKASLPQVKDAAEKKALEQQEQLDLAALNARIAVEKKQLEIATQTDETKRKVLEIELPALKQSANIAYRKAGKAIPYPDIPI